MINCNKNELDTEYGYLRYIDKIITLGIHFYQVKGRDNDDYTRTCYVVPHNSGYIYVILCKNSQGEYLDYCRYQRRDTFLSSCNMLWDISTPEKFCKMFIPNDKCFEKKQGYRITPKEIKSIKALKFYNKQYTYWIDKEGYFYFAYKNDLPNSKKWEEYEKFNGNSDAVFVSYTENGFHRYCGWFENEESFLNFFNEYKAKTPPYQRTPTYEIINKGYKKVEPDKRMVIFILPHFDVDIELAQSNNLSRIAYMWLDLIEPRWVSNPDQMLKLLEDILLQWKEYKKAKGE